MKQGFVLLVSLLLGALFIWTGVGKIKNPVAFAEAVRNYRILTDPGPAIMAHFLPWLEFFVGLGVLWKGSRRGAAAVLVLLLFSFLLLIGSAWIRGLDIACGCFGESEGMDYTVKFVQNTIMLILAIWLWWASARSHEEKTELSVDV